jgi:hypothetical protein
MPRLLLACTVCLILAAPASARPAHKQALAQYFGSYLPKKLNDCRTCHLPDKPMAKEDDEKPHNPFGKRLAEVRAELKEAGKPTSLDARLDAILDEDSDGDGVSNLLEILSGHFPGDKDDRPTDAELAQAKSTLVAFLKEKKGYPWRPLEVVKRPAVPAVKDPGWVKNPIDAFIAAEHEALGLRPRPEAPRAVLLRRVYLDLVGLPPTPAQLHAFLDDPSPNAYEKVVDKLLASPQYGERWGRHWMDVWRYSDWAGFGPQVRDSQPFVWRWRDWIVASLNADKGYDRMILEMFAGDELAPEDPQVLAATGYLVRNYKLLSREKWLQDTVEHTFMAFQGITIQCCRCHDHMYDPILQREYFQVRAVFEPHLVRTDRVPGEPDIKKDGLVRAYDGKLDAPTYLFIRGDDRNPDKSKALQPGVPEALGRHFPKVEPIKLPWSAAFPDRRDFIRDALLAAARAELAKAHAAVHGARGRIPLALTELPHPESPRRLAGAAALAAAADEIQLRQLDLALAEAKLLATENLLAAEKLEDDGKKGSEAWTVAAKGARKGQLLVSLVEAKQKVSQAELAARPKLADAEAKKAADRLADARRGVENVEARMAEPLSTDFVPRPQQSYPEQSTGRRLAFAKWLADAQNPLTARVAVNHLWARHFGQGIVPTVHDFGRNGRPPSHPALLDWLAAEFMDRGWSMKHLHKLIVTSSAYRMASTPDPADAAIDRDNKYLWRFPTRRLEAEAVRDAVFFVAGRLDLTMGGPDIDFPLGLTVPRRSLYFRHAAEKEMEFLTIFDAASVTECYERRHSIVPQQALALLNSAVTLKHARLLARALAAETRGDAYAFTVGAFENVLSRPPTDAELSECLTFLEEQTKRHQTSKAAGDSSGDGSRPATDPALRARENLVHALMNHHEFVTIR